jgi:hypothetical protein
MECTLEESPANMATKQRLRSRSVRKGRKNRAEAPKQMDGRYKSHMKVRVSPAYTRRGTSVGGDSQTSLDTFPLELNHPEEQVMMALGTSSSASTRPKKLYDDKEQSVRTGYSVRQNSPQAPLSGQHQQQQQGSPRASHRRPTLQEAVSVDEARRRSLFDEDSTASSAFVDLVPPSNRNELVIERYTSNTDSSAFVDWPPTPYSSGPIAHQNSSWSFLKQQDSASHKSHDLEDEQEEEDMSVNSATLSHAPTEVQANTLLVSKTSSMSDSLSAAPSMNHSATKVATMRRLWRTRKTEIRRQALETAHEDWCDASVNEDWPGGPPELGDSELHSHHYQHGSSSMRDGGPDDVSETLSQPSTSGGWCNWLVCSS